MSSITVLRPDWQPSGAVASVLAPWRAPSDGLVLGLVDNRKPNGGRLLELIGEEVSSRLPVSHIEVHRKPSSGRPIDPDAAKVMAARAHLVITGVGD